MGFFDSLGSALGPIGAALSIGPAIYKGIKGIGQISDANKMHPNDPGYQMNQGVIDNAKTLSDQYGNYQLPGYSKFASNIDNTFQGAFDTGVQGATSGGDVLDLATRMAYGKNQAYNNLDTQNAQGKQGALSAYLQGNAAAGQEYVNKNAYDRDIYQQQLREKAALKQAGEANLYGGIDQTAGAASKYLFSQSDSNNGQGSGTDAVSSSYNKYYFPNGTPKFDMNGNPIQPVMSGSGGGTSFY